MTASVFIYVGLFDRPRWNRTVALGMCRKVITDFERVPGNWPGRKYRVYGPHPALKKFLEEQGAL